MTSPPLIISSFVLFNLEEVVYYIYFFLLFVFQLIISCSKGGTSIEDLAEKFPDMIVKVCCDSRIV